jgi:hypothetical protein
VAEDTEEQDSEDSSNTSFSPKKCVMFADLPVESLSSSASNTSISSISSISSVTNIDHFPHRFASPSPSPPPNSSKNFHNNNKGQQSGNKARNNSNSNQKPKQAPKEPERDSVVATSYLNMCKTAERGATPRELEIIAQAGGISPCNIKLIGELTWRMMGGYTVARNKVKIGITQVTKATGNSNTDWTVYTGSTLVSSVTTGSKPPGYAIGILEKQNNMYWITAQAVMDTSGTKFSWVHSELADTVSLKDLANLTYNFNGSVTCSNNNSTSFVPGGEPIVKDIKLAMAANKVGIVALSKMFGAEGIAIALPYNGYQKGKVTLEGIACLAAWLGAGEFSTSQGLAAVISSYGFV